MDKIVPVELKCNRQKNPIGLTDFYPVFSFLIPQGGTACGYRIAVSSDQKKLDDGIYDLWDTGKVDSIDFQEIRYDGKVIEETSRIFWKAGIYDEEGHFGGFSSAAYFETGIKDGGFTAKWICDPSPDEIAPMFRERFLCEGEILSARLYVTGLGYYRAYINGKDTDDYRLKPLVSDYDERGLKNILSYAVPNPKRRIYYDTYDVTESLGKANALVVVVGNGWYNQRLKQDEGEYFYGTPRALYELHIYYADGRKQIIASGRKSRVVKSDILENMLFRGMVRDFRRYREEEYLYAAEDPAPCAELCVPAPTGELTGSPMHSDKIAKTHTATCIHRDGCTSVYDFGVNHTGVVKVRARGKAGERIVMTYGEHITEEGELDHYSTSWGVLIQKDEMILAGKEDEFCPFFTFHGYRYMELKKSSEDIEVLDLESLEFYADIGPSGKFTCSNELFNRMQTVYLQTQLSNMHGGIPSDCPHRERRGYTGDGQTTCESAMYALDAYCFYRKWLTDIFDSQSPDTGFVPHSAPFSGGGGGPGWGSAVVVVPDVLYRHTVSREVMESSYPHMFAWVNYLETRMENGIVVKEEEGYCLGEWFCPTRIDMPESLVNTYFYLFCVQKTAKFAELLGKKDEAEELLLRFKKTAKIFHDTFYDREKGVYDQGKWGANLFPLSLGIVPPEEEQRVWQNTLEYYKKETNLHFDVGIFGLGLIGDVFLKYGGAQELYQMLNQTDFPSIGYMLRNGETTFRECWTEKYSPDIWNKGVLMKGYPLSYNHPMFGSFTKYFYKAGAGIRLDRLDERIIEFKPEWTQELTFASADIKTVFGTAAISWRWSDESIEMSLTIPPGCVGELVWPQTDKIITVNDGRKKYERNPKEKVLLSAGNYRIN